MKIPECENIRKALKREQELLDDDPNYAKHVLAFGIICKKCSANLDVTIDRYGNLLVTDFKLGYKCLYPNGKYVK